MLAQMRRYWRLLSRYLGPLRAHVIAVVGLLLAGTGMQLANPQIVRFFLDTVQTQSATGSLFAAGLLYLCFGVGERLARLGTFYFSSQVGWRATNALRSDLTQHVLDLDMSFHKQRTAGELIEQIDGDVSALAEFFATLIARVISSTLLIGGVLLVLWLEDWRLGVGMSVYALVVLLGLRAVQDLGVQRWAAFRETAATFTGFLEERLAGAEDIRSAGAERYVLGQFEGLLGELMRRNLPARMLSNVTYLVSNLILIVGYALGLGAGALLYLRGEASIGSAFMLVAYIGMLASPLEQVREQIQQFQQASASITRIEELQQIQPSLREQVRAQLPAAALAVEFAHVEFAYRDSPDAAPELVLRGIDLRLEPGQVLGLLGRTGSGKTTLSRLLFRLYDPSNGAIRLGGCDLRDLALSDLRERVGMVTQEVQIFQASVRDNLTLFDRRISDERIWAALAELGLDTWARRLPQALDTRLGAGGQGLSAGEAQLLAFARVFLRDPGLVILDEASSRLDPATERLLEQAIERLLKGRSAIIIAHRLGTVQRADRIAILEHGELVEHGERVRLAADENSRFAALLRAGLAEVLA